MIRAFLNTTILLLLFIPAVNAQVFYRADQLSVNTAFNEMAPVIYKNGIIFSSDRKSEVVIVTVDQSGNFLYNLYFSKKKGPKNFSSPDIFAREISTRYNQSSASISSDGNTLFYTGTLNPGVTPEDTTSKKLPKNGIFISQFSGKEWLPPVEFPYNSEEYNVGYPCISSDGKRLYFASEMPSGYGGYDLYYSDLVNDVWKEPVNLGQTINTNENEVFPFIYHDTRLYFSSRGHGSEGGLDIFYSDLIDGKWILPVRMPKPFNSRSDDFALVANEEMDTGYFASNRKGTDDIYMFVSTFPSFDKCPPQVDEEFCYEFYESGTMSLDTTTLRYEWDLGDGTKIRDIRAQHCYSEPGYYLIQLNVIDTLTNEVSFNQASYDLTIERVEQPYITCPDRIVVNDNVNFDAAASSIRSFTIENYYWDFGDGSNGNDPAIKHRYTKPGDYIIRLGLTGTNQNEPGKVQKACASKQIKVVQR